jgi:enoyl-CoA hydratase
LSAALARDGAAALAEYAEPLPPFSLAGARAAIDRCFSAGTIGGIVSGLDAEQGEWAGAALKAMRQGSPSSLHWTLKALLRGRDMTLPQALDAEFALTRTTTVHPDFLEGVRAMVVDKDRRPVWQPATIEEVEDARIEALFVI